jgi:iron uptake system component EfeO
MLVRRLAAASFVLFLGCSSASETPSSKSDADYKAEVTTGMHDAIAVDLAEWRSAVVELQSAAPKKAWSAVDDAAAIAAMKSAWRRARVAYEHVEGAVAPLFPDRDFSADARYDDYLVALGGKTDENPFDGDGVTGMHGIERILFADAIAPEVVAFESSLPGYSAARFPATDAEAADFRDELCQKLVDDIDAIVKDWQPAQIDLGTAYQGLVSLMNEQREKVNKAATGEEESRYARMTMFDLRNNLDGTVKVYGVFRPWILSKTGGAALDADIVRGFEALRTTYAKYAGDAIPAPPASWSSDKPSSADLATPFGQLFTAVRSAVDPTTDGSIVDQMNGVADVLGFPEFKEE